MKMTWLEQGGLRFEAEDARNMIDPYVSDSVSHVNSESYRRVPVDTIFFDIQPDIMILTHYYAAHYDPETAERYIITAKSETTVLVPSSVWPEVLRIGGKNNHMSFDRHTSWIEKAVCFRAVKTAHSDAHAIGVILFMDGKIPYYRRYVLQ